MHNELDIRARDIRFYDSIIFQADLLDDEKKREKFIREIALHNIHLSTLCIVSNCFRNEELEKEIISLACTHASSDNHYKKPMGFLALFELERYDRIASIIAKTKKHNKALHNSIIQIIIELKHSELLVRFIRILVENSTFNTNDLILDFIKAINKSEIEFSIAQKKQLEDIYEITKGKLGFGKNRIANMVCLKFLLAFQLPKKMIPRNINQIALQMLENLEFVFIKQFYDQFGIQFPFSNYELCNIFIECSEKGVPRFFLSCFFEVTDVVQRNELIVKSLKKDKHFAGFVFSLITDETAKIKAISKYPGHTITKYLRDDIDESKFSNLDQFSLLQLIYSTLNSGIRSKRNANKSERKGLFNNLYEKAFVEQIGKIVSCKITGMIPKTVYVQIQPDNTPGSIWINELSDKIVKEIKGVVHVGEIIEAVIIGKYKGRIQLSVKRLKK